MNENDDLPPYEKDSSTSKAAAASMKEKAPSLKERCKALVAEAGERGMICDEIERAMQGRHQTISARVRELVLDGEIVDSGRKRKGRSGRDQVIYILAPKQMVLRLS